MCVCLCVCVSREQGSYITRLSGNELSCISPRNLRETQLDGGSCVCVLSSGCRFPRHIIYSPHSLNCDSNHSKSCTHTHTHTLRLIGIKKFPIFFAWKTWHQHWSFAKTKMWDVGILLHVCMCFHGLPWIVRKRITKLMEFKNIYFSWDLSHALYLVFSPLSQKGIIVSNQIFHL